MAAFRSGERVRTTRAMKDVAPDVDVPSHRRDMPLTGVVVGQSTRGSNAGHHDARMWIVRLDDIDREIEVDESDLMTMEEPPA